VSIDHSVSPGDLDSRFDEAEADVDRGEPWLFRENGSPNPLTIRATEWSTGVTKLGEAEFLNGVDRNGTRWSVLVGPTVLRKRLVEGVVEEWDDERKAFAVIKTEGRVRADEVVSIKFLGDVQGAQFVYPKFSVSRKPPTTAVATHIEPPSPTVEPPTVEIEPTGSGGGGPSGDDIPFR
jgi:hypothetical protein